jgi:hypothetical protein
MFLRIDANLESPLGSGTTRTPGDVDELGLKLTHAFESKVQIRDTFLGLGGEVLEGEEGLPLIDAFLYLLNDLYHLAVIGVRGGFSSCWFEVE